MLWRMPFGSPRIHDITTDPADPPRFVELVARPYPHGGRRVPELQRAAYPQVAPLAVAAAPERTFAAAVATAHHLGWRVVREDAAAGELEAVATTRLLRFKDDVAVRVRPSDTGAVVDLRSVSRVGQSDFGANAKRILAFAEALRARLGEPGARSGP